MQEIKVKQESSEQSTVICSEAIRVLLPKKPGGLGVELYHGRQSICYLNLREYGFGLPELIEAVRQYEEVEPWA